MDYIHSFSRLHTDKNTKHWSLDTNHRAPHKPLLLLSIIELFKEGGITNNCIELTPELGEIFALYWSKVMPPDQRGNIALPFFHLRYEKFWNLIPRPGKEEIVKLNKTVSSIAELNRIVLGATLDPKLYSMMCSEKDRNILATTLIESYFSQRLQKALLEQKVINYDSFLYSQQLIEQAYEKKKIEITEEFPLVARNQGFRRAIISTYNHRCAFCGIRMLTLDGHTVVDAAHIIPWSISKNDDPRNGMALCRLCHWTFDEGLMSVSIKYEVMISPQLAAFQNIPAHLSTLKLRNILGPEDKVLWPNIEYLEWHRNQLYRKR